MNDKPKGGRGKIETERNAAVVADRAAGMAYKLLERKYGISRSRLVHIINAARDAQQPAELERFSSVDEMLHSLRDAS